MPKRKAHRPDDLLSPRTDLALEALQSRPHGDGVEVETDRQSDLTRTRVHIQTEPAAQRIGKPIGSYVTIDAPALLQRDQNLQERVSGILAEEIARMLDLGPNGSVLVVGLGNRRATPDALGPRVVEQVLVTRHLQGMVPKDLLGKLRPVSALAPGVLGTTGIETGEILKGIIQRLQPDAVIAVDALASQSLHRILTTVQIADTGIQPGSGVGNERTSITPSSLGVKVVAVGVPTVVHAVTIVQNALEGVARNLREKPRADGSLLQVLTDVEKRKILEELLIPSLGDLMVTPKEIDIHIEQMAAIVAGGINQAVHPGIGKGSDPLPV